MKVKGMQSSDELYFLSLSLSTDLSVYLNLRALPAQLLIKSCLEVDLGKGQSNLTG